VLSVLLRLTDSDYPFRIFKLFLHHSQNLAEGSSLSTWNNLDSECPQTINNIGDWYSKLNKIFRHAHPNTFHTIKMLEDIPATNQATIIQILADGKQSQRRRKHHQLKTRL
jgi:hypothetical protein